MRLDPFESRLEEGSAPAGSGWREAPPVGSRWKEAAPVDLARGVAIVFGGRSCSEGEGRGEAVGDPNRRGARRPEQERMRDETSVIDRGTLELTIFSGSWYLRQ